MSLTYIGIDPGQGGGLTAIEASTKRILGKIPMPLMPDKKTVDGAAVGAFLTSFDKPTIVLEEVAAMPKQGVSSTFSFGKSYGIVLGIIQHLGFPYILVKPSAWSKVMHEGLNKELESKVRSEMIAKRLYPNEDFRKTEASKKSCDGIIDGLMLALYGIKTNR